MAKLSWLVGAIAAGLVLSGCAHVHHRPAAGPPAVAAHAVPSASPTIAVPGPAARAQAQGPQPSDLNRSLLSLRSAEDPGDLPLGPGDLVEVSVFDVAEFSSLRLRIPNSGQVTLPLIGAVPAAGLTAVELQAAIRERLQEKYMHDPQVSLFVHEQKSQRVLVTGAVRNGGVFTLTSPLRLADVLAMAGGLADDAGQTLYVIRRAPANGGESEPAQVMTAIDVAKLAAGKDELNLPLRSGDVVEVPRAGSFYVGGEVNRPGSFPLKARTTLDQATVLAGGLKDVADWDDVKIYRTRPDGTREITTHSLDEFAKGKPAPEVQANDIVVVGRSGTKTVLYAIRDIFRIGVGVGANATVPVP